MADNRKIGQWEILPSLNDLNDSVTVQKIYDQYQMSDSDKKDCVICASLNESVMIGIPLQGNEEKSFNEVVKAIYNGLVNEGKINALKNTLSHFVYAPIKLCINKENITASPTASKSISEEHIFSIARRTPIHKLSESPPLPPRGTKGGPKR